MTDDTTQHEDAPTPQGADTSAASDPMLAFVVKCAAALTLVGGIASVALQPDAVNVTLSFVFGAALALGNFWLSRRIVARMVTQSGGGGGTAGLLVAKMLGFFGLVYAAFRVLSVDEVGFTGGLMVVVLSIVIGNAFGPKARVERENG